MARARPQRRAPTPATIALGLALGSAFGLGCATETAERGQACTRTAQCAPGLACVEGECSSDLDAIGRQGSVPMLMMPDAGADAAADAGADAATDASAVDGATDAGDGGSPEAGADASGDAAAVVDDDAG